MRPYTGLAARVVWPEDTSMKSHPAALNRRATATASSAVLPPGAQSWAEMRTLMGRWAGHTARMAANTSSGYLQRAAMSPPYASVRRLVSGVMKLESK